MRYLIVYICYQLLLYKQRMMGNVEDYPDYPPFVPNPNLEYKIVSVMNHQIALTIEKRSKRIMVSSFISAENQIFRILPCGTKYVFVNPTLNAAICVEDAPKNKRFFLEVDSNENQSSYFDLIPVKKGEWAGRAVHIMTFDNKKTFDIAEGKCQSFTEVVQWQLHEGHNQQWLIIPIETFPVRVNPNIEPQVTQIFKPRPHTTYTINSLQRPMKCLTVHGDKKIRVNEFRAKDSQIFHVVQDHGKYRFILAKGGSGLCVEGDKKDNAKSITCVSGSKASSLFEIVRNVHGKWAKKAYVIKTHASTRGIDVAGGWPHEDCSIIQWDLHYGDNQLWFIEPFYGKEGMNSYNQKQTEKVRVQYENPDIVAQIPGNKAVQTKNYAKLGSHSWLRLFEK